MAEVEKVPARELLEEIRRLKSARADEEAARRHREAERRLREGQAPSEFKHLWRNVRVCELEGKGVKVALYGDDLLWLCGDAVIKKIEIKLAKPVALSRFSELLGRYGLAMAVYCALALCGAAPWPREKGKELEILEKWRVLLDELERP